MRILAIDTCAKTATCSLLYDGMPVADISFSCDTHSSTLLPMIDYLLNSQELKYNDVDAYAVSVGPGSFTGVRIGVSTVKGLAFAENKPCIGVSTLVAMAENFRGVNGIVVPALDARRETVYSAVFRSSFDGSLVQLKEDAQIPVTELVDFLKQFTDEKIYFTGDSYDTLIDSDVLLNNIAYTPLRLRNINAVGVATAAWNIWNSTEDKSIFTDNNLLPKYLKATQAERELKEGLLKIN